MKLRAFILFLFIGLLTYAQNIPLYVGTYTDATSKGIYYYDFNTNTGELSNKKLVAEVENPSFLAFSSNKKFLYAVSEVDNFNNTKSGYVNAFSVSENGNLHFINSVSSNGAHPCHIQLNKKGTKAAVSNYNGGTVSIHSIKKGAINTAYQIIDHNKTDVQSHVHSAKFLKKNLFVADLGRDFLARYVENNNKYTLKENHTTTPKAGPRHFEISKKGKYIYVINELNSSITVFKKMNDTYRFIQNLSTLDDGFTGENSCADIHLSKNEEFLYGSNRGENSIAVFKRNKKNGMLEKIQTISVEGNWPRNFTLSPKDDFLLVANQKSKNISVFSIDKAIGTLTFKNNFNSPTPVCLLFKN